MLDFRASQHSVSIQRHPVTSPVPPAAVLSRERGIGDEEERISPNNFVNISKISIPRINYKLIDAIQPLTGIHVQCSQGAPGLTKPHVILTSNFNLSHSFAGYASEQVYRYTDWR
jgi:hypothetical protein